MVNRLKLMFKVSLDHLFFKHHKSAKRLDLLELNIEYFQKQLTYLLQGAWAIGCEDVQLISRELKRLQQYENIAILEVGGGASTVVFLLQALQLRKSLVLHTLEASEEWLTLLHKTVGGSPDKISNNGIIFETFKIDYSVDDGIAMGNVKAHLFEKYDIIFIDAPPDTEVEDGRLKTAMACKALLKTRGFMMIHDTERNMEMYAFKKLQSLFLDAELLSTPKGMGILRFPKDN
jgi:hypothetical protein